MAAEMQLFLNSTHFQPHSQPLVGFGSLTASSFRFRSGVHALRVDSPCGSLVMLPFQGQQIWSLEMGGADFSRRNLTMGSMFDAPQPTRNFLETFGGFLQHCGVTGVGNPTPADTHPLHGELPNAPHQEAYLVAGEDERGAYIGVGGSYRHTLAFAHNYVAAPLVKLYADDTLVNVAMTITNDKQSPMELMYLAHVNFRPVDNGRLVYTAPATPQHVRVRQSIPSHVHPAPGYVDFIAELADDPRQHEVFRPDLAFDPEVVFFIDYLADAAGWAHTLQVHPDGSADYLRHRPTELPKVTRWISRTPDQDAVALAEVGTCEPDGYTAEKRKGNVRVLGPGEHFHASFDVGAVGPAEASRLLTHVADVVESAAN